MKTDIFTGTLGPGEAERWTPDHRRDADTVCAGWRAAGSCPTPSPGSNV